MSASAFPGSRVEWYRAGTIAITKGCTTNLTTAGRRARIGAPPSSRSRREPAQLVEEVEHDGQMILFARQAGVLRERHHESLAVGMQVEHARIGPACLITRLRPHARLPRDEAVLA